MSRAKMIKRMKRRSQRKTTWQNHGYDGPAITLEELDKIEAEAMVTMAAQMETMQRILDLISQPNVEIDALKAELEIIKGRSR